MKIEYLSMACFVVHENTMKFSFHGIIIIFHMIMECIFMSCCLVGELT